MFRYIKVLDSVDIGAVESPNYIRWDKECKCYVLCDEREANGIAYSGKVYHLLNKPNFDNDQVLDDVTIEYFDGGSYIIEAKKALKDADALIVDQEYRLTMLELGV